MASEIWHEAYADMVDEEQTEYMLEKFLSPESIGRQISEGTVYEFITEGGEDAGFIAYKKDGERLFLSKFYIKKEYRRSGLAAHSMRHIADVAERMGLGSVYLTVNRGNRGAISAYEHMGFVASEDVDTDIGNGFFMYDHIMELRIRKN
ncbi:MAG: GNAT family N-acetyltransferase [Candidatus Methanomethylophilaceae archaeon]